MWLRPDIWLEIWLEIWLQVSRDCLDGAGGNTLLTNHTARSRELELEALRIKAERCRGTNACAESAVDTQIFVNHDFAAGKRDADFLRSHPVQSRIKLINVAR